MTNATPAGRQPRVSQQESPSPLLYRPGARDLHTASGNHHAWQVQAVTNWPSAQPTLPRSHPGQVFEILRPKKSYPRPGPKPTLLQQPPPVRCATQPCSGFKTMQT